MDIRGSRQVKRSGSEFLFEFSHAYQCLRPPADFRVGRFCWTFYWTRLSPPRSACTTKMMDEWLKTACGQIQSRHSDGRAPESASLWVRTSVPGRMIVRTCRIDGNQR